MDSHLVRMGVVFTPYDYETFQLDVTSERNIYEKFFVSIALNTLFYLVAAPMV